MDDNKNELIFFLVCRNKQQKDSYFHYIFFSRIFMLLLHFQVSYDIYIFPALFDLIVCAVHTHFFCTREDG
jgi:hypothetical protein